MKPYKILDCPNYETIQHELLNYIDNFTTLRIVDPRVPGFDFVKNPVSYVNFTKDLVHFAKHNSALLKWVLSLRCRLKDAYFTLAWTTGTKKYPQSSCPLHIDKPPVNWKINFPILNMEHTCTRFYKLKNPALDISSLVFRHGDPDSKDRDNYSLEYTDFDQFDCHDFDQNQPILMNGQIPHDIGFYPGAEFPRLGIQIMLTKEPTHLL